MRARLQHVPKGQKFIAQGKRSDTLGIMCREACALLREKVLKQSVLCLLLPFLGAWCDRVWRFTQGVASLALG